MQKVVLCTNINLHHAKITHLALSSSHLWNFNKISVPKKSLIPALPGKWLAVFTQATMHCCWQLNFNIIDVVEQKALRSYAKVRFFRHLSHARDLAKNLCIHDQILRAAPLYLKRACASAAATTSVVCYVARPCTSLIAISGYFIVETF